MGLTTKFTQRHLQPSTLAIVIGLLACASTSSAYPDALRDQANTTNTSKKASLEEVLVTAQHRSESIQDVAIGMTAVTGEDLNRRGISNFEDLTKAVAGLHAEAESGFASASLRIRGVGTAGLSIVDPSVGVVIDGIYQSRIGTAFSDLSDVDRIEVLRGPQGTLFGKNTTAGVINISTKRPDTRDTTARLQFGKGNYNSTEVRAAVNLPIIEDQLAARLSGYSVDRDGHNTDLFKDEDTRGEDRYGFRGKLLFSPNDELDIQLIGDYKKSDLNLDQSLARYGTYDNSFAIGGVPAPVIIPGVDPKGRPLEDVAAEQGKPLPSAQAYSGKSYEDGRTEILGIFESATLQIDWQVPGHLLTSISGYQRTDEAAWQDSDATLLDLMSLFVHSIVRTTTQELRFSSDGGPDRLFDYVGGFFYQSEKVATDVLVFDGDDAAAIERRDKREIIPVKTFLNSESFAAFAHLTLHVSDSWEAVAGVRYSTVDKFADSSLILKLAPPTGLIVPPNVPLIPGLSASYDETTFTAKLKHYFNTDQMTYFSVDRGFKTGGFNLENITCPIDAETCLPDDMKQFLPELTHSVEIGWKSEWFDNSFRLNGAVFYQVYQDFQVNITNPRGSSAIVSNASDLISKGLELDFVAVLSPRWTLNGSTAWIQANYDQYDNAPCSSTVSKASDCRQDLSGAQLDNAPEFTANLGFEFTQPGLFSRSIDWYLRGDTSYRDDTFLTGTQSADSRQVAFFVSSARTGLRDADGLWKAEFWVDNLSDETYGVVATRPAFHTDGLNLVRGMPRTAGLNFEVNF
jgi:iron complex outermembrane receptor protein